MSEDLINANGKKKKNRKERTGYNNIPFKKQKLSEAV